jgi:hypothetical protein
MKLHGGKRQQLTQPRRRDGFGLKRIRYWRQRLGGKRRRRLDLPRLGRTWRLRQRAIRPQKPSTDNCASREVIALV